MLVNFRFKNFRSFYKETVLSMEATKDKELREINTFSIKDKLLGKGENELLKSAVIFGGNASGKSNVFKAFAYMKNVVLLSASQFPIVQNVEPFLFYSDSQLENSLFEVEIIQNNTFYKYGFQIKNGIVEKEWLDKRKERLTHVFIREDSYIRYIRAFKTSI